MGSVRLSPPLVWFPSLNFRIFQKTSETHLLSSHLTCSCPDLERQKSEKVFFSLRPALLARSYPVPVTDICHPTYPPPFRGIFLVRADSHFVSSFVLSRRARYFCNTFKLAYSKTHGVLFNSELQTPLILDESLDFSDPEESQFLGAFSDGLLAKSEPILSMSTFQKPPHAALIGKH
ncbi:hypothetical protein CBS12448_1457 [Aspergillus niger]|nr:hypothetical protein CBS12448_1457 [Aspergillus niger]KAI3019829.1 hypothetical protein CBS147482_2164 [Aspergillus niger]